MKKRVFFAGANRGGKALSEIALQNPEGFESVIIADPKDDRAARLANKWTEHGIRAE
ncbi:hypothetical protein [Candidatus Magnetominusculus dajiuhuensis]|uniref:hypothetical protein n=1 Tax=Candidatus Magnetominusculus dajiuhuensis TaxID=3137712 RepID=UPI003B439D5B